MVALQPKREASETASEVPLVVLNPKVIIVKARGTTLRTLEITHKTEALAQTPEAVPPYSTGSGKISTGNEYSSKKYCEITLRLQQ